MDRAKDCSDVVWRFEGNPVITRDAVPCANSIFNSAVVHFKDGYAGVFRIDDTTRAMRLHAGFSDDAINWRIDPNPIKFIQENDEIGDFEFGYDPRVCMIDDRYYVTWCNGYHGPTIGVAYTDDFKEFHQLENAFLPFNRNGVLFPRKINGKYALLSRPSDNAHTAFGSIFYSESPDLKYWGCHRHVMDPAEHWENLKIGAGPTPIETEKGWLLFHHGVLLSCNGYTYSMGAALLDIDKPWKVIARTKSYLLAPQKIYECVGDVPNVVFPCAALVDDQTGRIAIYYGAADTVTCLAFTTIEKMLELLEENTV